MKILNMRSLLVLVFLITFMAGCSVGEKRVDQGSREGILHFGNGTEPQGVDPHVTTGIPERNIQLAIFEGLVSLNSHTLEPEPAVAERWEVSDDGRTYRFYFRENAKWSNGDPVTPEDFRWSWWRALQATLGNSYVYMFNVIENAEAYAKGEIDDFQQVGIRVRDERTLEVTLAEPTPYFLQLLDHHSYYPVHRTTIEAYGDATDRYTKWARPGNIVTNGPFEMTEWKLNRRIRVERNPHYWDAENVRLNGVVFYPTENVGNEERVFRAGHLHKTNDIPLDKIPGYRDVGDGVARVAPYLGTYFYRFNTEREPLDDSRVRRALAMSVDLALIAKQVMHGIVEPAYAFTPPGIYGYQPPQLFDFDPDQARKLLSEAGFPNGEGFPKLELLYNSHESHRKIAEAIQQMWRSELNIDIELVNQEWKVYLDSVNQSNYDIARAGWIGDYVDPNNFIDMFLTDGGNNRTGWSDPEYDRMVQRDIPRLSSRDERNSGFFAAETRLMEAMPIMPIYTYSVKYLVDPSVKGMPVNVLDHFSFKSIYLEP